MPILVPPNDDEEEEEENGQAYLDKVALEVKNIKEKADIVAAKSVIDTTEIPMNFRKGTVNIRKIIFMDSNLAVGSKPDWALCYFSCSLRPESRGAKVVEDTATVLNDFNSVSYFVFLLSTSPYAKSRTLADL